MPIKTNNMNPKLKLKKTSKQKAWSWLKTLVLYSVVFLVIYTAVNWWRQPIMPANPQLQLTDYQGHTVNLAALSQDKPTLIYFWGTWCPICTTTSPSVNRLATAGDYPVVTVAVQSGSNQQLTEYLNEHNYNFTTINDQQGQIFDDWQGQVTPSYVILKDGEMTQGLTGIQPLWSLKLRLWLSSMF
ncbi:protein disulfide oxidoreductase [Psychrobacter sp. TAE2020]|uniref:protein disulfide oxidoreductase n=1 Tax=Psychrobacter sp. TAE2020 TaxID=2846762 RepID=UPI001E4644B4|nr:protein disulfide oxidoreductase [Psychrobacter sp. TAE2020]